MSRDLLPTDVLFFPKPGRLIHDRWVAPDGNKGLTLYYNEKEVTFDDPALLPFGERLLAEPRFLADDARSWSDAGYAWEQVTELVGALVDEGILQIEGQPGPETPATPAFADAGSIADARAWTPETCAALGAEIFGVPLDPGNLESLVRCVRIAHPALDVGGRQIGEANVFPIQMRLDLPTKRKACPFRGSRHEHELPMNMTGLEPVHKCWRDIHHNLRVIKGDYFRRRPAACEGLTVVDLYVLGTILLSIPAFMMFRADDRIANGELPLEASSLFRVSDGIRMTSRHMLINPSTQFGPDVVPTAERLFHFADREVLFVTDRGVCAGPPQMIAAFLEAVVRLDADGAPTVPTEACRLGDVESATSYGIAACELEAVADQFWLRQWDVFARLLEHLVEKEELDAIEQRLRERLELGIAPDALAYLFLEPFVDREEVHDNFSRIIRRCHELRGIAGEPAIAPFDDGVSASDPIVVAMREALVRTLPDVPGDTLLEIAIAAARLFVIEEQTFPLMAKRQAACNAILRRPPPSRAFDELAIATAWPRASLRALLAETLGIELGAHGERSVRRRVTAG